MVLLDQEASLDILELDLALLHLEVGHNLQLHQQFHQACLLLPNLQVCQDLVHLIQAAAQLVQVAVQCNLVVLDKAHLEENQAE